jgi:hypothetical protein
LSVAAIGEEWQAAIRLAAVPIDHDHLAGLSLPRPGQVAVDEIELVASVVRRVEHVAPDA